MRARRTTQSSLFDPTPVDHPVADELERVVGAYSTSIRNCSMASLPTSASAKRVGVAGTG